MFLGLTLRSWQDNIKYPCPGRKFYSLSLIWFILYPSCRNVAPDLNKIGWTTWIHGFLFSLFFLSLLAYFIWERERERASNIQYCNSFPAYSNFFQTIINQIFAFLYSTCQTSIKIAGPTVFCWVTLGLSPNLAVNELVVNCTALTMATHLCIRVRSFKKENVCPQCKPRHHH